MGAAIAVDCFIRLGLYERPRLPLTVCHILSIILDDALFLLVSRLGLMAASVACNSSDFQVESLDSFLELETSTISSCCRGSSELVVLVPSPLLFLDGRWEEKDGISFTGGGGIEQLPSFR